MTIPNDAGAAKSFVRARLPWIAGILAAAVYLLTFNHWLSLKDLEPFARATRQSWYTGSFAPVFNLVTTPFKWVSEPLVPVALNLLSVVCAFFTLVLLARSVTLLPQDRTLKQRERERNQFGLLSIPTAWIPPVLAVAVCGLQLTFWENATNVSANMLDVLLFAYSVRCLLEYRIDARESWLMRAIAVYAALMSESWVFLALLPGFIAALIWLRGVGFFQLRFLTRIFLCALVGLLFYLYLPLVHYRTDGNFLPSLKFNIATEIRPVITVFRYVPHHVQFLLTFTSLLPLLLIAIRWKSHFGDSSQFGVALTTWIFHLTHATFLVVCIWTAFDPGFSLRDIQQKFGFVTENRDRFLPLYYLGALCVGYFAGYFLLVFRIISQSMRRANTIDKTLSNTSVSAVVALLILAPLGLLYKNIPQIRVTNGPAWMRYASAMTENLPPHAILLSDDTQILLLAQAWLARERKAADYVFLETFSLKFPVYHRFQKEKHPDLWPPLTKDMSRDDFRFMDNALIDLMARLSEKTPLYYLKPNFGAYYEYFYPVPHGMVYELKQYPTNTTVSGPSMTEAQFAENENFWKVHDGNFRDLLPAITPPDRNELQTFRQQLMTRMHIPFEKNPNAVTLTAYYSRTLNTLGIGEQQMGSLEPAGEHFADAAAISPDNVVAEANLDFNRKLRQGEKTKADSLKGFEEQFGKFSGWEQLINANGLFDTATGCLAQGVVFSRGNLRRQAAQQFERVLNLDPDDMLARLWLARIYLTSRTPEKSLLLIEQMKAHSDSLSEASITPADVFNVDLSADYTNRKDTKAAELIQQTVSQDPIDTNQLVAALEISLAYHQYTNALATVNKLSTLMPDDIAVIANKGFVHLQLQDFNDSIAEFTQVISSQPTNYVAILDRAVAYLKSDKLQEAKSDYETLQMKYPYNPQVNSGLGDIALQQQDTNAAIRFYETYMTNNPPADSPDTKSIMERLRSLKNPPH